MAKKTLHMGMSAAAFGAQSFHKVSNEKLEQASAELQQALDAQPVQASLSAGGQHSKDSIPPSAHLKALFAERKTLNAKIKHLEAALQAQAPKKGDTVVVVKEGRHFGKRGTVAFVGKNRVNVEIAGVGYLVSIDLGDLEKVSDSKS